MDDPNNMNHDHTHRTHEGEYGETHWTDMNQYGSGNTHTSPVHEYQGFHFGSPTTMEPAYSMSIPPPYSSHQQLQPLIMPQWPSMLASQSGFSPPPITSATTNTPISATSTSSAQSISMPLPPTQPTTTSGSTPRRTLTDKDRKAMCEYHQANPTVKQTEIGAIFGVERSTVSKVLRLKEKFLNQDDGSPAPVKKPKSKFPDIDRALQVWVDNRQKKGEPINDAAIRERARQFAISVGNEELQRKVNSSSWLERFKSKHNIGGAKDKKSASNDHSASATADTSPTSSSHTPSGVSPVSPLRSGIVSPPMSPRTTNPVAKMESSDSFFNFEERERSGHHGFSDALPTLANSATSPTSPFWPESSAPETFSPSIGSNERLQMPGGPPALRPRSQTFPNLSVEPGALLNTSHAEEVTPKYSDRAMSFDLFDSPLEEGPASVNPLATMKRNNSAPNVKADTRLMQPPPVPPLPKLEDHSPVSPSQDDARKALEVVMTFFQNQPGIAVDPQDFVSIGRLMEKLKLVRSPSTGPLPGGFHPVAVEEDEHESPRMRKKRSIRSL